MADLSEALKKGLEAWWAGQVVSLQKSLQVPQHGVSAGIQRVHQAQLKQVLATAEFLKVEKAGKCSYC